MPHAERLTRRHVHLYFSPWQHESRAWRAGASALEAGLTDEVHYVGYRVDGLADEERIDERQLIRRIGAKPVKPGSPRLLRALSLPKWYLAAARQLPTKEVTLVTAHSLAALPAGLLVARRARAGLLYDAHELETEREGWSPMIRRIARVLERMLIRRCDHTIVVNDSIRAWYERAYPGLCVSTVRNVPVIPPVLGESSLRRTIGISEQPLLYVYCGLLGEGRGLSEMIEAFAGTSQDIHLAIIGFGPLEADVRAAAAKHANIHFHPAVKQSELLTLMRGADVGAFLPSGQSESYHHSLPNKVFEYCASGLALLVSDAPELKRFAEQHPLARAVPISVESIRRTIEQWSAREIREGRATMRFTPPNWNDEVARLLQAYATVDGAHRGTPRA